MNGIPAEDHPNDAPDLTIDVEVGFDPTAKIYHVVSSDLPGLHIETSDFETFVEVARDAAPDLIANPGARTRLNFRRAVDLVSKDER